MCGIAGYYRPDKPADEALSRRLAESMKQRGPDATGIYADKGLALAHARLSVIDLTEAAAQPFSSEDGRYTLVFNGEIFHYGEMRRELEKDGVMFRSQSDTEVLLAMLVRYGTDALPKLNGFFAFALYDKSKRTLLLGRDRLGIKPLFYCVKPGKGCAFASRLDTLRMCTGGGEDINQAALAEYLCYQYISAPKTIYEGVSALELGCYLKIQLESGECELHRWWSPEVPQRELRTDSEELRNELKNTLRDAVKTRLTADVPVGIFLSGGLDSALIASLAAAETSLKIDCFTIGFPHRNYDESEYAARTADWLNRKYGGRIRHHVRSATPDDFERLRFLAGEFGQPYADASMLPCALLAEFVREHVTVALSGDGADELFGGYERYRAMNMLRQIGSPAVRRAARAAAGIIPDSGERTKAGRIRRFLRLASLSASAEECYDALQSHFTTCDLRRFAPSLNPENAAHRVPELKDFRGSLMVADLKNYLPGDILPKVDVSSMAYSLEVRNPFLDYRVAELALTMPSDLKLQGKLRKKILGEVFADDLPDDLPIRKKRGFGVPVSDWINSVWREQTREIILGITVPSFDVFEKKEVVRMLEEHHAGRADYSYPIFSLLMLGLWQAGKR